MLDSRRWTARSIISVIALSLVATSLVALVVTMSTSRIGTIKLSENSLARSSNLGVSVRGGSLLPACSAATARCQRDAGAAARGSGTPVPSWELALAGLVAAGAAGVLWKTRRRQLIDASQVSSSPESPPRTRRVPANPRETVLAAFSDIEERLTSRGVVREAWEAPESYLARAIPERWRAGLTARKLARLYALARYSLHPIDSSAASQAQAAATELAAGLDSSPDAG